MPEPIVLALMVPLAALCLGVGGLQAWVVIRDRRLGRKSFAWPTAPAVVTASRLACTEEGYFQPVVTYTYRVGHEEFTGGSLSFTTVAFRDRVAAESNLREPGSSVQVSFDPGDPGVSVIDAGPQPQAEAIIAALLFLVMGLGLLLGLLWV